MFPHLKKTTTKTPQENLTKDEQEVVETAKDQNALSTAPPEDEQNVLLTGEQNTLLTVEIAEHDDKLFSSEEEK